MRSDSLALLSDSDHGLVSGDRRTGAPPGCDPSPILPLYSYSISSSGDNLDLLKTKLKVQLVQFEKCKAWTDITTWLHKIEELLRDHPTPDIPEKILLAKRLAQCLNPNLPPGLHQSTLKVYRLIFEYLKLVKKNLRGFFEYLHLLRNRSKNQDEKEYQNNLQNFQKIFSQEVSCISIGLFPFFQFANPSVGFPFR